GRGQVHLDAALFELFDGVHAESFADLGQNPRRRFHEYPSQVVRFDVLVVLCREPTHVLQLAECLDTGESTTDNGEGEHATPLLRIEGAGGLVQLAHHVVTQVNGLADGLETNALFGEPGDRQ